MDIEKVFLRPTAGKRSVHLPFPPPPFPGISQFHESAWNILFHDKCIFLPLSGQYTEKDWEPFHPKTLRLPAKGVTARFFSPQLTESLRRKKKSLRRVLHFPE